MSEELVANFTLSEGEQFDALFTIDTQLEVQGKGVIDVTTTDGVALVTSKTYVYEQGIASDTWVIKHDLNKHPSVYAVDSAGKMQIPDEIIYDSENQVTVEWVGAFAGKAYLN